MGGSLFSCQAKWVAYFTEKLMETNFYGATPASDLYSAIIDGLTLLALAHKDLKSVKDHLDIEKGVHTCKY